MANMAQFTGFMSLVCWALMILTEVINTLTDSFVPHQQNQFVLYSAILFALWSIGWTVRDAMEKKAP